MDGCAELISELRLKPSSHWLPHPHGRNSSHRDDAEGTKVAQLCSLGLSPKQWTGEPPLMDQTHVRLLWNGQEQSLQETLPNLWLRQASTGLLHGPKLQMTVQSGVIFLGLNAQHPRRG